MSRNVGLALTQMNGVSGATAAQAHEIDKLRSQYASLADTQKNHAKRAALETRIAEGTSKLMQMQADGAGVQADAFKKLGVTQAMLRRGNTEEIFEQAAEGLKHMRGGTEKTSTAMALFGRGWQTLRPLIKNGKDGIEGARHEAEKYGAVLSDPDKIKQFIKAEHEMRYATLGLQVAFGQQLMPAVTKGIEWFTRMIGSTHENTGAAKTLNVAYHAVGKTLGGVTHFLEKHQTILDLAVGTTTALTAAFVAWKVGMGITKTIAAVSAATSVLTGETVLLNGALMANPIGLVLASATALGVGFYLLYQRSETVRRGVDATFHGIQSASGAAAHFVEEHWRGMAVAVGGPFAAGAVYVHDHWSQIKSDSKDAFDKISDEATKLERKFKSLDKKIRESGVGQWVAKHGGNFTKDAIGVDVRGVTGLINGKMPNERYTIVNRPDTGLRIKRTRPTERTQPTSRTMPKPPPGGMSGFAAALASVGGPSGSFEVVADQPIVVKLNERTLAESNARVHLRQANRR